MGIATVRMARGASQSSKAAASGWIGSALEYYDFFIYATAASLVFPQIFFPSQNPTVAIVASLATYGVGYVARPIGAFVLGHWGDTHGRKNVLVVCMFLMGFSTMLVGVLPTYEHVGIWAPILLVALRLVQGFAVAGEVIGTFAIDLDRRKRRRLLHDFAGEARQQSLHRRQVGPRLAGLRRLAFGVVGIGLDSPLHREAIGFFPILHERHGLGRLAECDGQDAGRQRVEGPAMPGLGGLEQAPDSAHRLGRSHAGRLVQNQPAIDLLATPPSGHRARPSWRDRGRRRGCAAASRHGLPGRRPGRARSGSSARP